MVGRRKLKSFGQIRVGEPFADDGRVLVKAGRTAAVCLLGGKARRLYVSPAARIVPLSEEVFGQ